MNNLQNQLQADFPYIPKPYLRRQLALHSTLYAPTYLFLSAQEKRLQKEGNQEPWPYSRKVAPYKAAKGKGKAVLGDDPEFEAERAWILEQLAEGEGGKVQEEEYEDNGDGIECGCCFSTYPFVSLSAPSSLSSNSPHARRKKWSNALKPTSSVYPASQPTHPQS